MSEENISNKIDKICMIELAKSHKKSCRGDCIVSLFLVRLICERAGLEFTKEEKKVFM